MPKPFFSRTAVTYFDVSNSWKPSSEKLKMLSTICCVSLCRESAMASRFQEHELPMPVSCALAASLSPGALLYQAARRLRG